MLRTTLKQSALAAVAIAATAAAIAPAAAFAATVSQSGGVMYITANAGETNQMRLTLTDSYVEIYEHNSGGVQPQPGTSCARYSPGLARCNTAGIWNVRADAGCETLES